MYSIDLIERVINYYKTTNSCLRTVGEVFQVSKSSVWRWVNGFERKKRQYSLKLDHFRDWIKDLMLNNPWNQLLDLSNELSKQFQIKISISSISRFLNRIGISYKKMRKQTVKPNNSQSKKEEFINKMRKSGDVFSFDEVGFQLDMYPNYGWSKKGDRCCYQSTRGGRKNYSGAFLISRKGIVHWKLLDQAMNVDQMLEFISELDQMNNQLIVMDNLRVHHNLRVKEHMKEKGLVVEWIPPYSPDMNPVEEMFSWLKRELRKKRVSSRNELLNELNRLVKIINEKELDCYFKHAFENY